MARYRKGTRRLPEFQAFCDAQRWRIRNKLRLAVIRNEKALAQVEPPPFEWETRGLAQPYDSRPLLFKGGRAV